MRRVNSQERPYTLTDLAPARGLNLTLMAVLEIVLHLGTILRSTRLSVAPRGMLNELNMELNVALPLSSLMFGETAATTVVCAATLDGDGLHLVRASASVGVGILVALGTEVEVWTSVAVPAITRKDFLATRTAGLHELGSATIVKVPQNHHRGMLCPTELVELVVVASAQVQEGLSIIEELTI